MYRSEYMSGGLSKRALQRLDAAIHIVYTVRLPAAPCETTDGKEI